MAALNTQGPAALNVGRHIEARHARLQAAQRRQARPAAEPGTLGVVVGVLGPVETRNGRNGPYLRATLTRTVDGTETTVVALVSARAMERAAPHFVEGAVRLYGEMRATTFSAIGPALEARSSTTAPRAKPKGSKAWWFARKTAATASAARS